MEPLILEIDGWTIAFHGTHVFVGRVVETSQGPLFAYRKMYDLHQDELN